MKERKKERKKEIKRETKGERKEEMKKGLKEKAAKGFLALLIGMLLVAFLEAAGGAEALGAPEAPGGTTEIAETPETDPEADGESEPETVPEPVPVEMCLVTAVGGEGGKILLQEREEQAITVEENTKVSVCVRAEPGYRIGTVTVAGELQELEEGRAEFTAVLEITADTEIEASFIRLHTVRILCGGKGSVVTEPEGEPSSDGQGISIISITVDAGKTVRIMAVPEEGHTIGSVQVNGEDQEVIAGEAEVYFLLEAIEGDKEVEIRFREVAAAAAADFSLNGEAALRSDGNFYVYAQGDEAVFSTEKEGMEVYDTAGNLLGGGQSTQEVMVTETAAIGRIRLYYQAEGEYFPAWHEVAGIGAESPWQIVMDGDAPKVRLTPTAPNEEGIYCADVPVAVCAEDPGSYSGLAQVTYRLLCGGEETDSGILYSYTDGEEIRGSFDGEITVDSAGNNSSAVTLEVRAEDRAGRLSVETVNLDIDITPPEIRIRFDNNRDNGGNAYFDAPRTATVAITERTGHFDASDAEQGLRISALDGTGQPVEDAWILEGWTTEEQEEDPDAAVHTAVLRFVKDAHYSWSISYRDLAGNEAGAPDTADAAAPFAFAVDTAAPAGVVRAVSAEGEQQAWDGLQDAFTFGFASGERISLTGEFTDQISPSLASVEYYKVQAGAPGEAFAALGAEELEQATEWEAFNGLEADSEEQFVVYFRLEDLAGNTTFLSTNGLTMDRTAPVLEAAADGAAEAAILADGRALYNGDVTIRVKATEPAAAGVYAGLRTVSYQVLNMGTETQAGVLFAFDSENPRREELTGEWAGEFIVDSEANNSNDVRIRIYAEDNAGNSSEWEIAFAIDITEPVVEVSYDNNEAVNGFYFNAGRTAVITITERNFRPEDVKLSVANADGPVPAVGGWSRLEGSGNEDDVRWTAALAYDADGDYTFDIAYTDLAGNPAGAASYGGSAAPQAFTIDQTPPVLTVSYDNNEVKNGRYFAAERTVTVAVREHNFDENLVDFTGAAFQDGEMDAAGTAFQEGTDALPVVRWTHSGDLHTAQLSFREDGHYTFAVEAADLAANSSGEADYAGNAAARDFIIDQTIAGPVIGGVRDGCAYSGDVVPTISFGDSNYDFCEVRLLRTRLDEKELDVTARFIPSVTENGQGGWGEYDTFAQTVENDGIYTLRVRIADLAGNERTEEVTFALNRFGSVYVYDDYLISLIQDGGQYLTSFDGRPPVSSDLVITEYSPVRLLDDSLRLLLTRNGERVDAAYAALPLASGRKAGRGESGWYQYVYTIAASNFTEDGIYRLSLYSSYDTADSGRRDTASVPENSVDERGNQVVDQLRFTVDTTAPEIRNIANLEETIIDAPRLEVGYTIVDVGGLASVQVIVNGKTIDHITDFGGENHSYTGSFILEEDGNVQSVRLIAADLAGNVTDTAAADFETGGAYVFHDQVTVSTNFIVRWYADKPLFWGSVGGAAAFAALALALARILGKRVGKAKR